MPIWCKSQSFKTPDADIEQGARAGFNLWTSAFQSEEVLPFHAGCTQWCCVKETAKYNPNMTIWRDRASKVGQGLTFVASLAYEEYANFDEVET